MSTNFTTSAWRGTLLQEITGEQSSYFAHFSARLPLWPIVTGYSCQTFENALNTIGPSSWLDLVQFLDTGKGKGGQRLRRMLKSLVRSGEVDLVARGTYQISHHGIERQPGMIAMRSGKLGVVVDKGEWVLLRSPKGVRVGDQVEWYVKDQMAEVERVVEATEKPFVGIYRRGRKSAYVEPITRGLVSSIDLIAMFKDAHDGDVVEAVICEIHRGRTRAKVTDVIRQSSECSRAAETMLAFL